MEVVKDSITQSATDIVADVKQTGISALDKTLSFLGVPERLTAIRENASRAMQDTKAQIEKVETIGKELRSVGAHVKNVGRAVTGKEQRQSCTHARKTGEAARGGDMSRDKEFRADIPPSQERFADTVLTPDWEPEAPAVPEALQSTDATPPPPYSTQERGRLCFDSTETVADTPKDKPIQRGTQYQGKFAQKDGTETLLPETSTVAAPYERVAKLQRRQAKANINLTYQQSLKDNPAIQKKALAKWIQKQSREI